MIRIKRNRLKLRKNNSQIDLEQKNTKMVKKTNWLKKIQVKLNWEVEYSGYRGVKTKQEKIESSKQTKERWRSKENDVKLLNADSFMKK